MNPRLANRAWRSIAWPAAHRFYQATRQVAPTQASLLSGYLRANADTDFGRRHAFRRLAGVADFQQAVPLSGYDDYVADIDRIGRGAAEVLTRAPVRLFEPSSGSTAATKLIPYTATLQAEFRRGLDPWIADLFGQRPALLDGPAYWSVTPLMADRPHTAGGIPIGFEADSAYLGRLGRHLVAGVLAVPDVVKQVTDIASFRYVTLFCLLRTADLRLISVWNPTFLTLLLAELPQHWPALLADLAAGTLTPPEPLDSVVATRLMKGLRPAPARARDLAAAGPSDIRGLWPQLALVSCWADGPAADEARRLSASLPGVALQPKGLLATEAFVSLPLAGAPDPVLAIRSHFFEFLPQGGGDLRLAHELTVGGTYEVVVTTGGGLYRYRLQDWVTVTGHVNQAPCLRFVGKADRVSDWFGEKLSEPFVAQALRAAYAEIGVSPIFALVAPDDTPPGFHYTLFVELADGGLIEPAVARRLAGALDAQLRANFHYDWCRRLGQLAPVGVTGVTGGASAYLAACQARGQRLGDIKPAVLVTTTGWTAWLAPGSGEVAA